MIRVGPLFKKDELKPRPINWDILATLEVVEFIECEQACPTCGEWGFRLIDESQLGGLPIDRPTLIKKMRDQHMSGVDPTNYLKIHLLATSGLFSPAQLREVIPYAHEHELEVCARAYAKARPYSCGCAFGARDPGDPEVEANYWKLVDQLAPVERDWIRKPSRKFTLEELEWLPPGSVPRQNRRGVRSPAAVRRRKAKRAAKRYLVRNLLCKAPAPVFIPGISVEILHQLFIFEEKHLNIKFKYIPDRNKWTDKKPPGNKPRKRSKRAGKQHRKRFRLWYQNHM